MVNFYAWAKKTHIFMLFTELANVRNRPVPKKYGQKEVTSNWMTFQHRAPIPHHFQVCFLHTLTFQKLFEVSVDIHGQPSTSSNYSNIHMQRSLAQTNQEDALENSETKLKEDRVARLSPLALRNRSRHDLNKPSPNPFERLAEHDSVSLESQELLSMETTVEYIAETAFNSSPSDQAVRQSKVARTSPNAIPIGFSGEIVQGTVWRIFP